MTLRKKQPGGEASHQVPHVHLEKILDVSHGIELLHQVTSEQTIVDKVVHIVRLSYNGVLSIRQFANECVQLNEVETVSVKVDDATKVVIFRSQEDLDNAVSGLIREKINCNLEGLVIQTAFASHDGHIGMGLFDFIFSQNNSVSDVHQVVVKVSNQFVNHDVINFDSWEVKIVLSVAR